MRRRPLAVGAGLVASASLCLLAPPSASSALTAISSGYSVSTRVYDGTAVQLRWNPCQLAVTYRVNAAAASTTAAGRVMAVADVRTAFVLLGHATGITFHYLGTTALVPTTSAWADHLGDAEIVVAWVDQGAHRSTLLGREGLGYAAGTGGFAYKIWVGPDGAAPAAAIGRGYVVLNAADNAAFARGFGTGTTRGLLLLHELGHVVGLRHVTSAAQVMYPVLLPRAGAAYGSGDLAGLRREGRAAGCLSVPAWVWADR